MFMHLRQLETGTNRAVRKGDLAVTNVSLNAGIALLLGLALIPTLSGVA